MKNNLTEKEINNLYNCGKEYGIKELQTKDRKKLLNIKELTFGKKLKIKKTLLIFQMKLLNL